MTAKDIIYSVDGIVYENGKTNHRKVYWNGRLWYIKAKGTSGHMEYYCVHRYWGNGRYEFYF